MSTVLYRFQNSGNDSFIDFLKGISIVLVVLSHTLPHNLTLFPIWGGSKAVPIFLAIQIFHAYKKGKPRIPNLKKVFNRVILPFIIFQCLLIAFLLCAEGDIARIFKSIITNGGYGPGSYYIYIYLQFAFILPFVYKWMGKHKTSTIFYFSLIISVLLEVIASYIDLPEAIYRLLAIRYFFLIFFGFLWVREGVTFGRKEIFLGIIGFFSVLYFKYYYEPLEPLFFDTLWRTDRWICYFFVMYVFVPLQFIIWKNINNKIKSIIQFLGTCSFEFFLMQMFFCIVIPRLINMYLDNNITSSLIKILLIQILSIGGGVLYFKVKTHCLNANKHRLINRDRTINYIK